MKKLIGLLLIGLTSPSLVLADRFSKIGDEVYDSKTELSWQSNPTDKAFAWQEAIAYCDSLSDNWRLPNIYEFTSLIDYAKYNPALATNLIDIKSDYFYWSSSEDVDNHDGSWGIYLKNGDDDWGHKTDKFNVLCVK